MYDGFLAITRETGDKQSRIAARLYPSIATTDFDSFVSDLDPGPLHDDLKNALQEARDLARDVLTKANLSAYRVVDIEDELQTIELFLSNSNCLTTSPAKARRRDSGNVGDSGDDRSGSGGVTKASANNAQQASASMLGAIIAAAVLGLGLLAMAIWRSRRARIYRMERLPRQSINLSVPATFKTDDTTSTTRDFVAMDISLGGMKLRTSEPIPDGAEIVITLPTRPVSASFVWATTHYAGILFDERLADDELAQILKTA